MKKTAIQSIKGLRYFLLLCGALAISKVNASSIVSTKDSTSLDQHPSTSIGVHVGTTGVGLHLYRPLGQQFAVRLGASFMPFYTNIKGTYSNKETKSHVDVNAYNASLLFSWKPFSQQAGFMRSFSIEAGGAYFFKLDAELETKLAKDYYHGDILVQPELLGTIKTDVKYKKTVSPYLGIAFNEIKLDDRCFIQLALGSYYLSKPTVSMEASGLLAGNTINQSKVQENIKNYRFLPRLEFGVNYRFKK